MYSPDLVSLEYTPSLSASGSVARIISASTSLASLNAYVNALGSSGLGYSSVVKLGSGFSCSGTEPKIKFYMGVKGTGLEDADKKLEELTDAVSEIVGL